MHKYLKIYHPSKFGIDSTNDNLHVELPSKSISALKNFNLLKNLINFSFDMYISIVVVLSWVIKVFYEPQDTNIKD